MTKEPTMVTAETLTDKQLVSMRNEALRDGRFDTANACDRALDRTLAKYDPDRYRDARCYCAEVWNARKR
jgi:hypothetical protein